MPAVQQQSSAEAWAIRRIHGVQQLSEVQIREAEDHWGSVSELHGRRSGGAPVEARENVLRMQPISGLRFRGVGQANAGEVPGLRVELFNREMVEGWSGGAMSERGVQV